MFRCMEVGNHPIFQRAHGFYVLMRLSLHVFCLLPHGDYFVRRTLYSHYRRLVYYYFIIMDYQGIGSP